MKPIRRFDVITADADGMCALRQLRLADPVDAILVTGLKREITLLDTVPAEEGDIVTVVSISLDRNREALGTLLDRGAVVLYFDHHYAGDISRHPSLQAVIDASGENCTSTLVHRHVAGRFGKWALVGAFGDELGARAEELARDLGLDEATVARLRDLGASLNYAAYGENESETLVPPGVLYRILGNYRDPLDVIAAEPLVERLARARADELLRAVSVAVKHPTDCGDAWTLPNAAWARRVHGTFANSLARNRPDRAQAVLVPRSDGAFCVSVRAPAGATVRADELCRRFPTGGGRGAAAGIDRLEPARLEAFLEAFGEAWPA